MGPTFSTILNEFWTDFLQFSAKDGGVSHPPTPPLMCAPVHTVYKPTAARLQHSREDKKAKYETNVNPQIRHRNWTVIQSHNRQYHLTTFNSDRLCL